MEWWKTIDPSELDVDWLDPGHATTVAAAGQIGFGEDDYNAMYKMLSNLANADRIPFTKSGFARTSPRLYSLSTCIKVRLSYELARHSGFNVALLEQGEEACHWFANKVRGNALDFSTREHTISKFSGVFLLSRLGYDGYYHFIIGNTQKIERALGRDFSKGLNMTLSAIGFLLSGIGKEYVKQRARLIVQGSALPSPLLESISMSDDQMRAFEQSSSWRRLASAQKGAV